MTAVKQLKATARDRVGKGAARAVRRQGQIPAVIYGNGQPAQPIALDYDQAKSLIFAGHFLTTIFEIDLGKDKARVIPRDFQLDPVKDLPVHVDFLRVGVGSTINVEVPVRFLNPEASPGLKRGGTLNVVRHTVELRIRVEDIPEFLVADLTGLDINDSIHISAIKLPEGARPTITGRDFTIGSIAPPTKLEEPTPTAAAATAEGAAPTAEGVAPTAEGAPAAGAAAAPAADAKKQPEKGDKR
jgi:large subunit ribosomal protein L25